MQRRTKIPIEKALDQRLVSTLEVVLDSVGHLVKPDCCTCWVGRGMGSYDQQESRGHEEGEGAQAHRRVAANQRRACQQVKRQAAMPPSKKPLNTWRT